MPRSKAKLITVPAAHGNIFTRRERQRGVGTYHVSFGTRSISIDLASFPSRAVAKRRATRIRRALHGKVQVRV